MNLTERRAFRSQGFGINPEREEEFLRCGDPDTPGEDIEVCIFNFRQQGLVNGGHDFGAEDRPSIFTPQDFPGLLEIGSCPIALEAHHCDEGWSRFRLSYVRAAAAESFEVFAG